MLMFERGGVRALIAAMALLAGGDRLAWADEAGFSQAQQDAIGKIAADYLVKHPEVLVQVSQALQQKRQQQELSQLTQGALTAGDALLADPATPAVGPKDAKVSVVEFFDYQCVYCYRMSETVEKLVKDNPKVRFVFKEFPVFGSRWPASVLAAETGQYVYAKKGADAYLKYHNGLYATGKNEGKLAESDIAAAAKGAGVALEAVKADTTPLETQLQANMKLGNDMGVSGTPTFIVMPSKGASADTVTVIPGATDLETLQKAIDRASAG
jgi:protein-disulfide isomerase